MALNTPKKVFIHHTGGTDANPMADTSHHTFEQVKSWHLAKGWDDIGYHYFYEKDGTERTGRPETMHGAHARGYNTSSLGLCMAGNFDLTLPTRAQEVSLVSRLQKIQKKWGIDSVNFLPHRSVANKTCYGQRLGDDWAQKLYKAAVPIDPLDGFSTATLLTEAAGRKDFIPELRAALVALLAKKYGNN